MLPARLIWKQVSDNQKTVDIRFLATSGYIVLVLRTTSQNNTTFTDKTFSAWEEMMADMDMTSMFEEIMGEEGMSMGMAMMKPGG